MDENLRAQIEEMKKFMTTPIDLPLSQVEDVVVECCVEKLKPRLNPLIDCFIDIVSAPTNYNFHQNKYFTKN